MFVAWYIALALEPRSANMFPGNVSLSRFADKHTSVVRKHMLTVSDSLEHSLKSHWHFGRASRMVYPHSLKNRTITRVPSLAVDTRLMTNFFAGKDTLPILSDEGSDCDGDLFSNNHHVPQYE